MKPRRSTSVGDLIAFYDNRGPVFVARCEDIGWKRQPGTLFFRDALKGLEKVTARSLREEA
jgi:hypothetical protein